MESLPVKDECSTTVSRNKLQNRDKNIYSENREYKRHDLSASDLAVSAARTEGHCVNSPTRLNFTKYRQYRTDFINEQVRQ